ncbi:hypothetical protein AJ79_10075 [Helicocarpus griseus UAMH5409]|uniref:Uncharacterized protein n=1 Tax=Helicocarpus griseus UAMH5409 TaxID=1447875 RepID=A0A2B7WFV2_9EURO|nr:hypothetical protein AJ79_10075 [Helicocarpus griseus UAMH5409]
MAIKTSCPPDIRAKSRIVAVCGATDYDDSASNSRDGQFFNINTEEQLWLTSEDPKDLLAKYGEYAHGDPRK